MQGPTADKSKGQQQETRRDSLPRGPSLGRARPFGSGRVGIGKAQMCLQLAEFTRLARQFGVTAHQFQQLCLLIRTQFPIDEGIQFKVVF
jgi:hypothetical protein